MSQETIQRAIQKAKEQVMWGCRTMVDKGYALGTAGNISARVEGEPLFVITPSARPYLTDEAGGPGCGGYGWKCGVGTL